MKSRFKLLAVALLVVMASTLSAAQVSVYRWNNYRFRAFGIGFPANTTAVDQAGIQVMVGDGSLAESTIFIVTVQYDSAAGEHKEIELLAKSKGGWATAFAALGHHDEDFRIVKVSAAPYQPSGAEIVAASVQ